MCLSVCLCVCLPVCLSVCPQISHEVNGFDLTSSALYHPSASVSSIFIDYVHSNFFGYIFFLPHNELSLVGLALDVLD